MEKREKRVDATLDFVHVVSRSPPDEGKRREEQRAAAAFYRPKSYLGVLARRRKRGFPCLSK